MSAATGGEGLFASLKAMAATLVAMGKTRLELLSTEIAAEKERLLRQLVLAQLLLFFLQLAVVLAVVFLFLFFEAHRLWVAGASSVLFLLAAGVAGVALVRARRPQEPPLADTLAELAEDLRQLKAATGHDQQSRS